MRLRACGAWRYGADGERVEPKVEVDLGGDEWLVVRWLSLEEARALAADLLRAADEAAAKPEEVR